MKIIKYMKVLSLSLCLTISTMGLAYADISTTSELTSLDTPVSSTETKVNIGDEIYNKQVEIDTVLFKDNSSELEKRGITVTHTTVVDGLVEIGIEPFNEKNAGYIYELLGNDLIKVVEEPMSTTFDSTKAAESTSDGNSKLETTAVNNAKVISAPYDVKEEPKEKTLPLEIIVPILATLMIAAFVFIKKIKSA